MWQETDRRVGRHHEKQLLHRKLPGRLGSGDDSNLLILSKIKSLPLSYFG